MNFKCHNCKAMLVGSEFDIGAKAKCPACGDVTTISLPPGARRIEHYTNGRALGSFLFAVFAAINLAMGYHLLFVKGTPFGQQVVRYIVYALVGAVTAGLLFGTVLAFGAFRVIKSRDSRERGRGYAGWGLFFCLVMIAGLAYWCFTPIVNDYAVVAFDKIQSLIGGAK